MSGEGEITFYIEEITDENEEEEFEDEKLENLPLPPSKFSTDLYNIDQGDNQPSPRGGGSLISVIKHENFHSTNLMGC